MAKSAGQLDLSEAIKYHYDQFPPKINDYGRVIQQLTGAVAALARYDQMLKEMHNGEILLAPLRKQEAVASSRMEGTVSTLDEVLRYEADAEEDDSGAVTSATSEAAEVSLYSRAMRNAQRSVMDGQPLSRFLIRQMHKVLLRSGRGAGMSPGEFKTDQNYLADKSRRKILFTPISPERLDEGMDRLIHYMNDGAEEIHIRTAVAHLEFEALHPFKDGNGRIGRMLIPLMLWKAGVLSEPYFYISAYFEQHRDAYIDKMREVSASGAWEDWIIFFLEALEAQANANLKKAEEISQLHDALKNRFRDALSSKWSTTVLDFLFTRPVFRNTVFLKETRIPPQTASGIVKALVDGDVLKTVRPSAGSRPALYSFEPLLALVRG